MEDAALKFFWFLILSVFAVFCLFLIKMMVDYMITSGAC